MVAAGPASATTVPATPGSTGPAPSTTAVIGTSTSPPSTTARTVPVTVTTRAAANSGVWGTVTAGPTCGVERIDQPCPPVQVRGTVEAVDGAGGVAGRGGTDSAGRYAIDLPPGRYTLRVAGTGIYPQCPETTAVEVGPGSAVTIDISCDTGIR